MPRRLQVPVDRALVLQEQVFVGAVRHGHDIDVLEFGIRLRASNNGSEYGGARLRLRFRFRARQGTAQWNRALNRVTRTPPAEGFTCSRKVEKRPITLRAVNASATR